MEQKEDEYRKQGHTAFVVGYTGEVGKALVQVRAPLVLVFAYPDHDGSK
jgi:hypothetical protein